MVIKNIIQLITCLFIFLSVSIKGQYKSLQGTWISRNNDVIIIHENSEKFNIISTIEDDEQLKLKIIGDTLSFYTEYTNLTVNKKYIDHYDFYIQKKTNSKLVLKPISILSKEFFKERKKLTFVKQEYNIDQSISFEKLIYHSTDCKGTCPIIDLTIDKNRNIYIKMSDDENRFNTFEGKLSEDVFNELINILKTSNLKTWNFPEKFGHDAPVTTLIIYYNGKRKYFKSMFPPTIAHQLIDFLYHINDKTELKE